MPQSLLLSVCPEDEGSDNLYFFSTNRKYYTNSQSFSRGCLSKAIYERRTSTGSKVFSFWYPLTLLNLVLLGAFTLIETIARKCEWNHFPRMRKVPFRLAFIAQKSLCLNSLKTISWHCRHDNVSSAIRKAQRLRKGSRRNVIWREMERSGWSSHSHSLPSSRTFSTSLRCVPQPHKTWQETLFTG